MKRKANQRNLIDEKRDESSAPTSEFKTSLRWGFSLKFWIDMRMEFEIEKKNTNIWAEECRTEESAKRISISENKFYSVLPDRDNYEK